MSESTSKPNRTLWIIVGVLGCLVLCLLGVVAVLGIGLAGGYFTRQPATPVVVLPTPPPPIQPTAIQVMRPPRYCPRSRHLPCHPAHHQS